MNSEQQQRQIEMEHHVVVQNVVCNAYLGSTVDMLDVCEVLQGRYDKEAFPAVVSIVRESGNVSVSVFESGQLVISGARSLLQALNVAYLLVQKLNQDFHRTDLRVYNFAIQNIVGSSDLGFPLNLHAMDAYNKNDLTYQPEDFEGLHLRTTNPKIGFMVFGSGKVVATGIKKFEHIAIAEQRLKRLNRYHSGYEQVPRNVITQAEENIRFDRKRKQVTNSSGSSNNNNNNETGGGGVVAVIERRRQAAEKQYTLTMQQRKANEELQARQSIPFQPLLLPFRSKMRVKYKSEELTEALRKLALSL